MGIWDFGVLEGNETEIDRDRARFKTKNCGEDIWRFGGHPLIYFLEKRTTCSFI